MSGPKFTIGQTVYTPLGHAGKVVDYATWQASFDPSLTMFAYMVDGPYACPQKLHGHELFATREEWKAYDLANYAQPSST